MIGLCSVTFRNKTVDEMIKLAKDANLQTIEWASDSHVPETDLENARRVAEKMQQADLKSNSYGSYYRLGSYKNFDAFVDVAKILGASTIRVWAGEKGSSETDSETREWVVQDAQRIGKLAHAADIKISLEYHSNTLTDTPQSTRQLMREIDSTDVLLYWQPAENLTVKERIESLHKLAPWITNVHVFHWENFYNRFPLADAFDDWKNYIEIVRENSPYAQDFLLEFVPEGNPLQNFFESAETLKKLVE